MLSKLASLSSFGVPGECSVEELSSLELTEFQLEHISSQQRKYNAKTYNIDWEEVKTGKAAGMPGGWVRFLYSTAVIF